MRFSPACSEQPSVDSLLREHARQRSAVTGLLRPTGALPRPAARAVTLTAITLAGEDDPPPWLWSRVAMLARIWAHHPGPHPDTCESIGTVMARADLPASRLIAIASADRRLLPAQLRGLDTGEHGWCLTRLAYDWNQLHHPGAAARVRSQWRRDFDTYTSTVNL